MAGEGLDALEAAFRVGYESHSQFGREYRRLSGESPSRHVTALKAEATPTSPAGLRLHPLQIPSGRNKIRDAGIGSMRQLRVRVTLPRVELCLDATAILGPAHTARHTGRGLTESNKSSNWWTNWHAGLMPNWTCWQYR
jgi:AraC-like DNA-binding protein